MFNLVLKDLLIQKKNFSNVTLFILSSFALVLIIQFFGASATNIITPFFFANTFLIYGCGFGEKNDVDIMINSLPVGRKDVVFSKYLSALVFFIIGIAITIVFSSIFKLSGFSHINRFINLQDIELSYVSIVVYSAIYLPIYMWLGYLKSQFFNNILNMCMLLCLLLIVMGATLIDNGTARKSIMNFVSVPYFQLYMFLACICFSTILIVISIFVSLKIYLNRNL